MDHMIVGIHQPNLFPWLGYFNKIAKSNIFFFLDDVQIQKTGASYSNRVSISVNGVESYITAPIRRKEGVWNVNQTYFVDRRWVNQTLKTLQAAYARAKHFKLERDFVFDLIAHETLNLADYNINFITSVANELGLRTRMLTSSDFSVAAVDPTERLIELIRFVKGKTYLSGKGAVAYQEEHKFRSCGIDLAYIDNSKLIYDQSGAPIFVRGLSVLDSIFHIGREATSELLLSGTTSD